MSHAPQRHASGVDDALPLLMCEHNDYLFHSPERTNERNYLLTSISPVSERKTEKSKEKR